MLTLFFDGQYHEILPWQTRCPINPAADFDSQCADVLPWLAAPPDVSTRYAGLLRREKSPLTVLSTKTAIRLLPDRLHLRLDYSAHPAYPEYGYRFRYEVQKYAREGFCNLPAA